jgi:hypothetical protein
MATRCVEAALPDEEIERIVRVWHRFPFYDAVNQRPTRGPGPEGQAAHQSAPASDIRTLTSHTDASTPALPGRFPGLMGREDVDSHFRVHGSAAGRAALRDGRARSNYFGAN